jgi:hypothetical protein
MKKISIATVGICMIATVFSCKEQEQLVVPESQTTLSSENVRIEDGRMKFSSWEEMKKFMKETEKLTPKMLNTKIGDSFLSHYESESQMGQLSPEIVSDHELDLKDSPISDPYFASLLNKNKEIEIGNDVIYKMGNDYCFYYNKADSGLVQVFYKDLQNGSINVKPGESKSFYNNKLGVFGTVTKKITARLSETKESNKNAKVMGAEEFYYFDGDHRMKAEYYTHSYLGYANIGVQTITEQYGRVFLFIKGWKSENVNYLNVKLLGGVYVLKYYQSFPVIIPAAPSYAEASNTCEAYIRVDYFVGPIGAFDWYNGQAIHTVKRGIQEHTIYSSY